MEFRFAVNEIFHQPIVEIGHTLIPGGFKGDRRQLWDTISKVTDVVNALGTASAHAQGLTRPITTSDRLRNSDQQILYLLVDPSGNQGKGAVTGMLKTGRKALYVFDRNGQHYQVQAPCILDFYVHESRQRSGLGKKLFEYMLQREEVDPKKLAIDRPSDKFLAFLNKHYTLTSPIRQMNNFVVYDGFFPKEETKEQVKQNGESPHKGCNGLQTQILTSPYGRYGAPRPPCSMGQIIHNQSSTVTGSEQTGAPNSFPQYHETIPIHHSQGQRVDTVGNSETAEQPLQQNEVSATSDGAPTSAPSKTQGQPCPRPSEQPNGPGGNNAVIAEPAGRLAKLPSVGNGISNDTDQERIARLTRSNCAKPEKAPEAQEYHWPFAVPQMAYPYEQRFNNGPLPTMGTGMHMILQPEEYAHKQLIAPPKEEMDDAGRPRRIASARGYQQYAPQHAHYHGHVGQYAQYQHQPVQQSMSDPRMNHQAHNQKMHQQSHHQIHQAQPHYNNNVTSYCFYGPRQSSSQMQHQYAAQDMYNDQQVHQQRLEQQRQLELERQQQQQQMWENYQNWLQYQYMMQYPQWTQSQYEMMQGPAQQVPQMMEVQQQQTQAKVEAPQAMQEQKPPEEESQPEKLLPQEPMEQALRPYYMQPRTNDVILKANPENNQYQVKSLPSGYFQRSASMYNAPAQFAPMQQPPMPMMQNVPRPQTAQSAVKLTSSKQEVPKSRPVSANVPAQQSAQELNAVTSVQQQMAPIPPMPPLTPEQIAQLTSQQQLMYYQQMLADPYRHRTSGYHPYNPVFGIPPQTHMPTAPPPSQSILQAHYQTPMPVPAPISPPSQEVPEFVKAPEDKPTSFGSHVHSMADIRAAGDAAAPPKAKERPKSPYFAPIIVKSDLEPLQPSLPFKREPKQDIQVSQSLVVSRSRMQDKASPTSLNRASSVKQSARIANVFLKNTINLARSSYEMCGGINSTARESRSKTKKSVSGTRRFFPAEKTMILDSKDASPPPNGQRPITKDSVMKRSSLINAFIDKLP